MLEVLGCNKEQYDSLIKTVGGSQHIYDFLIKYGTGQLGLYYYIDVRGRFIPIKYRQDHIAKLVLDCLNSKQKLEVLRYIEDLEDGEF